MLSVGLGTSSWALGISVAAFTLLSGFSSFFLLILYIRNGQRFNYISLLALAISLDKFNSFAQQLYTLFNFRDIQLKAYNLAVEYFRCRGAESLPLFTAPDDAASVFIHVQNFLINAQGLLFFYWSLILFSSAWNLSPVWWKNKKVITATKISCLLVPALQLGLLRVPAIRDSDLANLMVMNVIVLINMGMSSVFLLLTLLYIISIHRETRGATEVRLSRTYDGVVEFRPKSQIASLLEKGNDGQVYMNNKGIAAFGLASDGWIIGRIALAFFMVEGLQVYVIVMQIFFLNRWAHFKLEWQQGLSAPVIDQAEEFANICSPIPSSFTGFLFLLVFGTTREARNQSMTLIKDTWNVLMFRPKQRVPSAKYPVDLERARLRKQRSGSITNRMYGITESHTSIMSGLSETPRSSVADSLNAPTMLSPTIFLGGTIYQDRHRVYGPRIVTELEHGTTGASGRYTKSPIRTTAEHVQTNFSSCRPSSESEAKGAGDHEIPIGVAVSSPSPRLIVRRYPDSPWSVENSLVISPKPIARMGNFEVIRHVSAGGSSGEGGVESRGN